MTRSISRYAPAAWLLLLLTAVTSRAGEKVPDDPREKLPPEALARLGSLCLWHRDAQVMALVEKGTVVLTGSLHDRVLRHWDVATGKLLRTIDLAKDADRLCLSP